ncbi:dynein regulatory complex subunit 4 [Archocentrus centrarchus]|uniref:dynein regulatory complex subunit 4 n=1 Tax=Archocentrus centrarchus TaxID=63155 RepID=UPI0011E9CD13|nr:dynein regulatory complex subunit 4 [Archocentrus centrarchus]
MPKSKKKSGNLKSSSVVDGLSTEDMSKDQLETHIIRLREELDREREERSYFQLERDKIQTLWEISKRNLEELKAELRNKSREKEEAEERHRVEITVYKQRLRHVLSEQHNAITEVKIDAVAASSLVKRKHMQSELSLHRNLQGLQEELTEKKFLIESRVKALQLKHQVELMELTNDYERRIRDIEVKYHEKMQLMIEKEEEKRRVEVAEIDDRMKSREVTLIEEHDRALRRAEEHFCSTEEKLLADRRMLKEELTELEKRQLRVSRELSAAQKENKRLTEALTGAQQKLSEQQRELEEHNRNKPKMVEKRAQMKVIEKELRDLTLEHDLLLQAFEKVQQERDELLKKQTEAILDMQQRSGLKAMVLERKLAVLTETLEKKEAQLCAALSASSADPTAGGGGATNKVEEIMQQKQVTIEALQEDLALQCKEYDKLLQTCRERLQAQGVPLYDFPFRSAQQILEGPPPRTLTAAPQVSSC